MDVNYAFLREIDRDISTRRQPKEGQIYYQETSIAEDVFMNTKAHRGNDFKSI